MQSAPVAQSPLAPTASNERIQVLDILRGFALFGVLTVNMHWFRGGLPTPQPLDHMLDTIVVILVEGKFYIIFSFLFGVGFAVQMKRARAKGVNAMSLYPRRLLGLLAIGVLHYVLIWDGDILRLYAILGFVLIVFYDRPLKVILIAAVVLLVLSPLLPRLGASFLGSGGLGTSRSILSTGTYLEIVSFRLQGFFSETLSILFFQGPLVLASFLLGLYAGRCEIFEHLKENRVLFRWGLVLGLLMGSVGTLLGIFILSAPSLACAYTCAVCLLARSRKARRWLTPFSWMGRMALTNYIMQSVIGTIIFYGYGYGFYSKVDTDNSFVLIAVIYIGQVVFSRWWLEYFRYGPLEWLWRVLTYGQFQPFRKPQLQAEVQAEA